MPHVRLLAWASEVGLAMSTRLVRGMAGIGAVSLVMAAIAAGGTAAARTTTTGTVSAGATAQRMTLARVGVRNATWEAAHQHSITASAANERFLLLPDRHPAGGAGAAPRAAAPPDRAMQRAGSDGVAPGTSSGFVGITGAVQAGTNGAFDLEPPDQGLCSNGTAVGEAVNAAYAVYTTSGRQLLPPVALSALFGQISETAGSFIFDPRCYYDKQTNRWFVIAASIPYFFSAHRHATHSYELIAVSQTGDPAGNYTTFAIETTDASDPGCPCYGDYPELGADAHGIYLTTDEFSIYKSNYNGSQIYAISKPGLAAAADGTGPVPVVVHLRGLPSPFPGETVGDTYVVSPASTPGDGSYDLANHGTEFFTMSDAFHAAASALAVYSLTNTGSLATPAPALSLRDTLVPTQGYTFPPTGLAVRQRPYTSTSQVPLAVYVGRQTGSLPPEGVLQADFDAAMQTTYTGGSLYTELTTALSSAYSSTYQANVGRTASEWFRLSASATASGVSAAVAGQGKVAVSGQSLLYPVLTVNGSGRGDMVFTLAGRSYYPSAAYVPFNGTSTGSTVFLARAGAGPEDGFTCYAYYVGAGYGGCRWGDYSAAVAVGSKVWMATEFIPSPSYRDFLTNWGTFVFSATVG
jgi:hypothetical protein